VRGGQSLNGVAATRNGGCHSSTALSSPKRKIWHPGKITGNKNVQIGEIRQRAPGFTAGGRSFCESEFYAPAFISNLT
jgi:hypothetical protein